MKLPKEVRAPVTTRTIETMHADYERFQKCGKDPKRAKQCNNVIRDPIIPIPISKVIIISYLLQTKQINKKAIQSNDRR